VLDTSYKFAETTTEKNIIVHDNYIYLIWILNVNYGFELWAKSPLIIKAQNQKSPKKSKIEKPKKAHEKPMPTSKGYIGNLAKSPRVFR
jgi:hypothetical protein